MSSDQNKTRWFVWLGVAFLQFIMTQLVTFLVALPISDVENFQQTKPAMFVLMVGVTFSMGAFFAGWLALKIGWLKGKPKLPARLIGTLVGAFIPLIIALVIYRVLVAGNPFLTVSILAGILGFHIPGWLAKD